MKKIFLSLFLISFLISKGQDTLVVLQYNLLNYGNYTNYCTGNNNNVSQKDNYIKTIVNYIKPDIFSVNEMVAQEAMMEHLKGKLNETWTSSYQRPPFVSVNSDYLANTIYYNTKKLSFHSQYIAQTYVRDVNVFKFYYNNSPQLQNGDTAFIYCVVAHLKAGSDVSNANKRKVMANNTMNYLAGFYPGENFLLMGDFNLYTAEEDAWKIFTQNSNQQINFNDPVNQSGNWNNNYNYRYYHTQSTHKNSNGCASGGGMDDRFDYILISNSIKNGSKKVEYIQGSYWAVGQDGKHFNQSLLDAPTNTTVPSNVLNALYKNSDHLPVMLKLYINQPVGIAENGPATALHNFSLVNPAKEKLKLKFFSNENGTAQISLLDLTGKTIIFSTMKVSRGANEWSRDISYLKAGFYLVRIKDSNGVIITKKLIKG